MSARNGVAGQLSRLDRYLTLWIFLAMGVGVAMQPCYSPVVEGDDMTLDDLERVLHAFEHHEVDYVLIGGGAVNAHGLIRATEDIDVMVSPAAENIERLKAALRSLWDDPSIDEIDPEEMAGEYPAVRYVPPEGGLYLDIVTRFGEAFAFEDIESERLALGDLEVTIATPLALYRMKKGTVRPIDHADALALQRRFDLDPTGREEG